MKQPPVVAVAFCLEEVLELVETGADLVLAFVPLAEGCVRGGGRNGRDKEEGQKEGIDFGDFIE